MFKEFSGAPFFPTRQGERSSPSAPEYRGGLCFHLPILAGRRLCRRNSLSRSSGFIDVSSLLLPFLRTSFFALN
ncbi:hypothetical protein E2C01_001188 [Portunus trituberculatus]|uniref:Uncharacterized protein n=1 Tax=Portunus trituberculatus TaxID=210409 RepID=A0A5B7CH02_PORTR|nr:hypothetical protein [Portunus trituberculatus]